MAVRVGSPAIAVPNPILPIWSGGARKSSLEARLSSPILVQTIKNSTVADNSQTVHGPHPSNIHIGYSHQSPLAKSVLHNLPAEIRS